MSGILAIPFKKSEDEDEESIQDIALWLIESLAINLPKKKIYSVLMEAIKILINTNNTH